MTVINETENGILFRCSNCNKIHFEYKNLNINFNDKEFKSFSAYFKKLDGQYWEKLNKNNPYKRKIIVPLGDKTVNFLLNNNELIEVKRLISKPLLCNFKMVKQFSFSICEN